MFDGTGLLEGMGNLAGWLLDTGELDGWSSDDVFSPWEQHGGILGRPDQHAENWQHQGTDFTCAVVSQQMILQQFGIEVSEAQLVYDAVTNGWLTDAGTSMEDLGRLLEHYGIDAHQVVGGGVESLMSELVQGRAVIVAVDADELWNPESASLDAFGQDVANHAVVVTGLDLSDPDQPRVHINDPGDPDGAGKAYPLEQFLDAWADSGNAYVATDDAPAGLAQDSLFGAHFDSQSGLYMDQAFWSEWLQSTIRGFDAEAFRSSLMAIGGVIAMVAAYTVVDSIWDHLDDAGRNDLFLVI
ncbi:MAG: hypothetical protein GXY83_07475 [Rhodopirellula sp.]|mgnify:CR=1 FL=1|nr:hypothetical protein [Rhodopirellula sp.]